MHRARRLFHLVIACAMSVQYASPAYAVLSTPRVPPSQGVAELRVGELTDDGRPAALSGEHVEGEVIVRFKPGTTRAAATAAHARLGARRKREFKVVPGLELAKTSRGRSVEATVREYEAMPEVLYAQPNYVKRIALTPNDPQFSGQWGLVNTGQTAGVADADIDAEEAWEITTGNRSVTVAVIDTGVDYEHPDLAPNMWTNPGEIPGNGIDDEGNGYVDDVHGYDTANNDGDPLDDNGHGTHVAGILGAQSNNAVGVAGTSWNVSIMAIKVFGASGTGTTVDILEAMQYLAQSPARIANNSWGGNHAFDQAEYDAIAAIDKLFVCAAGNGGADGVGDDNESAPYYPASYDLSNILAVGASTGADGAAAFSNYGAASVDVFAPGVDILSTEMSPRILAVASDATENAPLFRDEFASLNAWGQYYYPAYPYQPWQVNGTSFTSAPSSAANVGYVDNQRMQIRQKVALDLSGVDFPALRFKVRTDLEPGADVLLWGALDASAGKTTTLGFATGDSGGEYRTAVTDLRGFAGQNDIQLIFEIRADSTISSAEGYEGVWIDDVSVFDLDPGPSGSPWAYETRYTDAYVMMSGTSMSAPFASGIAALLLARYPAQSTSWLKATIMSSAEPKSSLSGKCVTGARVNARSALASANSAPVAVDDTYAASEGSAIARGKESGVLLNDTDGEADRLSAVLVNGPSRGELDLRPDGSFNYTPPSNWSGTEYFTYRATDGIAESGVATVTLAVTTLTRVYRFFNRRAGTHFYTADEGEKERVRTGLAGVYTLEGEAYRLRPDANDTWLHRFYRPSTGTHFYTASTAEKDDVIRRLSHVYVYEGPAYRVSSSSAAGTRRAVHRFYNVANGTHFYTASEEEMESVRATLGHIYVYEGAAFWLAP